MTTLPEAPADLLMPQWLFEANQKIQQHLRKSAEADKNLALAQETISNLTRDVAVRQDKLDQHAPSIDRLTKLIEQQRAELEALKAERDGLKRQLNDAAEALATARANGAPVEPIPGDTPLMQAAESLAILTTTDSAGDAYRRKYLRKRGWRCPEDRTWEKPGMGMQTLENAVKMQAQADGKMFALLLGLLQ